jgi:hypothetical protein
VNPILAISNDIPALPGPTFVGQLASRQPGPGGFAPTFAAARSVASASENGAGGAEISDGSSNGTTADAKAVGAVHAPVPVAGNYHLRKLLNSSALLTASTMAGMNAVVPGFIAPAAVQISSSLPQASFSQLSVPQTSFPQTSVAPALTAIAEAKISEDVARTVQTPAQAAAYDGAVQSTPAGHSAASLRFDSAIFNLAAVHDGAAGNLASGSTSGMLIANPEREASRQETPAPIAPATITPATQRIASSSQTELASANPTVKVEDSQVPRSAATTGQSVFFGGTGTDAATGSLGVSSLRGIKDDRENLSLPSGRGSWSLQPPLQADQTVEPTMPAPAGLTNPESRPSAAVLVASADFLTSQANAANVAAPDAAVQSDAPAQTGTGDPLLGAINSTGKNLTSTILNPLLQLMPAGPAMTFAAAGAEAVPAASVHGQVTGGRSSILNSLTAAAGPASREAATMANQTPFSIFFSGPASGTESAAATLPKMILPGTGSAIRGSHSSGAEASGASAQSNLPSRGSENGTLQSSASQSGASQNAASSNTALSSSALSSSALSNGAPSEAVRPNGKEPLNGSESGNSPVGQISRRDADLQAAGAQLAVSQTGTAPAPAPATSPAATLPLGGPVALVADPQPKAGTLPETASASPPSTLLAAPEIPGAAAPGQVQLAQMISRAEQSEMRIGMNTSAFGSVEVRAVVHSSDVGLVIGSEKGDLRALMASDLPAITNTLQQQSLRLNSVNFMQGFAFSNNASGGGDSQQRSFVQQHAFAGSQSSEALVDDSVEALAAGEFSGGSRGLSILA